MSSLRPLPLALAALATGAALTLAGACGGSAGRTFVHAAKFVVTGSHGGLSCDDCHDPAKPSFALVNGGVDCLHCHGQADVAPMHASVTGFAYDDASCIGCHKDGKTPQFDHAFFPIGSGSPHQNIACSDCHGATRQVADLECTGCHTHDQADTDAKHAGVAGYQWSSPACYGCHKDGRGGLPSNHDAELFPVTGTPHANVACSQCHGATKAVVDLSCIPCHAQSDMATKHASIPASYTGKGGPTGGVARVGYQYASTACVGCHADGQVNRISSHPSFRTSMVNDHHRPFCLNCHQAMRSAGDKPWGRDFKAYTCLDCHTDNNGGGGR